MSLSEHEIARRASLEKIIEMGINPYPAAEFTTTASAKAILNDFEEYSSTEEVVIAGRMMSRRVMGKASFAEIKDSSARIQIYLNRDDLCPDENKELYNNFFKKYLDIGDILGIRGFVFKTKTGEISIHTKELTLLSKSLRPLPIVKIDDEGKAHDTFSDPEQRYRQRYVDLIVNDEVKDTFIKRSQIIQTMRTAFNNQEFLEVETPILQPIPGGASARPFITQHNALGIPLYLRIANELYLKRLIVGGFDGVYEFAKDFRNEGMDRTHNPEFTVVELYVAYKDYNWMMDFTEKLLEEVAVKSTGNTDVTVGNETISFKKPFQRISIFDSIKEHTGYDISEMELEELSKTAKKLGIEVESSMGTGKLIDEIFGEKCEHKYIQPTFITDYPKEMSPLTKEHRYNSRLTERFELMVNGKEIANAYSELNDPIDQRKRFEDQLELSEKGDDEAMFIDHDFIRALEYGMPPTSGIGIGIDRLVMLLTNNASIQEVLFFPQMKPEKIKKAISSSDFIKIGVSESWAEHMVGAGFTPQSLKQLKPGQVQQKLSGYRKKNKLDIPAVQLDEVSTWLEKANQDD